MLFRQRQRERGKMSNQVLTDWLEQNRAMLVTRSFQASVRTPQLCVLCLAWKVVLPLSAFVSPVKSNLSHTKSSDLTVVTPKASMTEGYRDRNNQQPLDHLFLTVCWHLLSSGFCFQKQVWTTQTYGHRTPRYRVATMVPTVCPRIECFMSNHLTPSK